MTRRKVKNGEKSPWGQCLTRPVPTVAAVLASDWCQKNLIITQCVILARASDKLIFIHENKVFDCHFSLNLAETKT